MALAECRRGHDLSVLGKTTLNGCRACHRIGGARSDTKRRHTTDRQITLARARLKYRMNAKITRIDELERMLRAS